LKGPGKGGKNGPPRGKKKNKGVKAWIPVRLCGPGKVMGEEWV